MFTGLVEEVGVVKSIIKHTKSARITLGAHKVLEGVKLGDSISTNGVCLTVTDFAFGSFSVDVMAETMRKSNLRYLEAGDKVNLERALRVGDRLGGHFVSGHIDGVGIIKSYDREENATWIAIETDAEITKYIIPKGSIAIDGVSLTVVSTDEKGFRISVIPHTKEVTILLQKKIGDAVNLECDMIGKYIGKLLNLEQQLPAKREIDLEFLSRNGFA